MLSSPTGRKTQARLSTSSFDEVCGVRAVQAKFRQAPLLPERNRYVEHLLRRGASKIYIRTTAGYLVQIVRLLKLTELRIVSLDEIDAAGLVWADRRCPHREKKYGKSASRSFIRVAKAWLAFLGKLECRPIAWFEELLRVFCRSMAFNRGLAPGTVDMYATKARAFLRYIAGAHQSLQAVSLLDVDAFLRAKVQQGCKAPAIASQCRAIRAFLNFAEAKGWCSPGIHLGIKSPRVVTRSANPRGPMWPQVKKLLASFDGASAVERRAKPMLMLCAIYGLRSSEVIRLQLEDFDWRNETFMVRRSKRGGVQHYPLQYDVGEAILGYLKNDRIQCSSRHLFVSLRPPYGAVSKSSLWQAVGPRLRKMGVELDSVGAHSLRHACATRLLHKGSSLRQIADFLGHRDLKSVGIYARCDVRLLRKVANFRLLAS